MIRRITAWGAALWLAFACALPALAVTEEEVQNAVSSQGRESVTGNLVIWFLCAIAFLKITCKLDAILQSLGLNVGHGGGSMLAETMMALRGLELGKALHGLASGKIPQGPGKAGGGKEPPLSMEGGVTGMVGRKLEQDTASTMSGVAAGGLGASLGAQLYRNSLGKQDGFASRVVGSVATGRTGGTIAGKAASQALDGYFGVRSSIQTSSQASSQASSESSNTEQDNIDGRMDFSENVTASETSIPLTPLALDQSDVVPVSPGYEAELAEERLSGSGWQGGIPATPDAQQQALDRIASGQMGNETREVEIGGGRISGYEVVPGRGQIQFAMYNAKQYERPSGHFTTQTSTDGEQWYKVYATSMVERTPTYKDEQGRYQYEERKVAKLPRPPERRR